MHETASVHRCYGNDFLRDVLFPISAITPKRGREGENIINNYFRMHFQMLPRTMCKRKITNILTVDICKQDSYADNLADTVDRQ